MTSPTAIQDKAPKPPGLLPKNVQSWLLISLAVLMVLIMWLTGGKKPPVPTRAALSAPAVQAPLEVNEAKIVDLQNRIQELQREQAVAQNALAQQNRTLTSGGPDQQSVVQSSAGSNPPERTEDSIQAERKKREYLSLFASNVALTYRKSQATAAPREGELPSSAAADGNTVQLAELLKPLQPPAVPTQNQTPVKDSAAESNRKEGNRNPVAAPAGAPAAATGKTYVLFEGTVLETVLVNRLDGQMSGPIECLLTTDVYSHDRQHLLIPAGTKLLGETRKVESFGQSRLAVSFHRLIMPLNHEHFDSHGDITRDLLDYLENIERQPALPRRLP